MRTPREGSLLGAFPGFFLRATDGAAKMGAW